MTFDIVIEHVNPATSGPFEFALGQYYFNINASSGVTSAEYNYYIVPGSTQFSNPSAIPRGANGLIRMQQVRMGSIIKSELKHCSWRRGSGPIKATFRNQSLYNEIKKKK